MATDHEPLKIDISVAHSARVYDYLLGGKDNFAVDRKAAEASLAVMPGLRDVVRQNRQWLHRAADYLAGDLGIRQFLDIGTGIPTSPNLHEVAQRVAPECRVVYVDNDPLVLVHARALLTSAPEGATAYLEADLRDPHAILDSPEVRETLNLTRPVAVSLIAILHFLADRSDPYGVVQTLVDALPPGSALALTHGTADHVPDEFAAVADVYSRQGIEHQTRSHEEVARFFDGLDLVAPGVVAVGDWRPDEATADDDVPVGLYGGVAVKHH